MWITACFVWNFSWFDGCCGWSRGIFYSSNPFYGFLLKKTNKNGGVLCLVRSAP